MANIKCGDFSKWNGNVIWEKVKNAGLTHAVLKVINRDFEPDEQFENNWKGCQLAGVHICGVYNYVYTPTVEMARAAAKQVIEVLAGRKVTVYMDIEDNIMKNLGSLMNDIIKAYKQVIEEAGCAFGIYTGMSFYGSYIKPYADEEVLNCNYWIAKYYLGYEQMNLTDDPAEDKKPDVVNNLVGWQYTSSGIVDGIDGVCDLSVFYGEYDESNDNENVPDNSTEVAGDNESTDNASEPVNITYAAYTDRWWDEVTNKEDWAGKGDNAAIKGLAVRVSRGTVKYRVHTVNGGWLPYVTGYDLSDINNGFAGDLVNDIDAVEIVYYTDEPEASRGDWKYVHYMVSTFDNPNFYSEQIDNETRDGMDGYAGVFGSRIDKVQMWVE